jgi:hypothetical protein
MAFALPGDSIMTKPLDNVSSALWLLVVKLA